ncbi:MAG: hypothetical protein M1834_001910 [Cirrosporium novae-zelandiae]|nr:MAG: hypothetical protein M1834_001910 [Cirrosporium novae-zelandiae]
MPRLTRAALRAAQNSALLNHDPDNVNPATKDLQREILGEVTHTINNKANELAEEVPEEGEKKKMPAKKGAKAGGRGRKGKKPVVEEWTVDSENEAEVLEDGHQSDASEAIDDARIETLSERGRNSAEVEPISDELPKSPNMANLDVNDMRTSVKRLSMLSLKSEGSSLDDDSFVDHIVSRSPAKPMRIEDSVDAIDEFEDLIEQVGQALPIVREVESPIKQLKELSEPEPTRVTRSSAKGKLTPSKHRISKPPSAGVSSKKTRNVEPKTTPTKASTRITRSKAATSPEKELSTSRSQAPHKAIETKNTRTRSGHAEKPHRVGAEKENEKPEDHPKESPGKTLKRRPSSLAKKPFVPAKSQKPLTIPTFELPGEAISRRVREQREERRKRQEEEENKRKEFKARPVMHSHNHTPLVRETAASRARASLQQPDLVSDNSRESSTKPSTIRTASVGSSSNGVRHTSLTTSTTRRAAALANTSVPQISLSVGHPVSRKPSMSSLTNGTGRSTVTKQDAAQQRQRAREIFERDKLEKEERERARKEKEEAAKKARAEAAERGRLASREWAERQRLKRMASTISGSHGKVSSRSGENDASRT